jgi:hypothetical protein
MIWERRSASQESGEGEASEFGSGDSPPTTRSQGGEGFGSFAEHVC